MGIREPETIFWIGNSELELRLIAVALDYFRKPGCYPQFNGSPPSLPAGFSSLVPAFGRALMPRHLEHTAATLEVSPGQLLNAARFFVRQVLLAPGAGPWQMLGCEAEVSPSKLHKHYQLLIRLFHPDQQMRLSPLDCGQAARLNQAYLALRSPTAGASGQAEGEAKREQSLETDDEALRAFLSPLPAQALALRVPPSDRPLWALRMARLWGSWLFATLRIFRSARRWDWRPATGSRTEGAGGWWPDWRGAFLVLGFLTVGLAGWTLIRSNNPVQAFRPGAALDPRSPSGDLLVANPLLPAPQAVLDRQSQETQQAKEAPQAKEVQPMPESLPAELIQPEAEIGRAEETRRADEVPPTVALSEVALAAELVQREAERGWEEEARRAQEVLPDEALPAELVKKEAEIGRADEAGRAPEARSAELAQGGKEVPGAKKERLAKVTPPNEPPGPDQGRRGQAAAKTTAVETVALRPSPDAFIDRLISAYEAGQLDGLMSLFAPDAVTTDGRGLAFVRNDYASLFTKTQRRKLAIHSLQWRPRKDGSQVGTGIFRTRTIREPGEAWREIKGKIRITLIPWGDGWRIAKMEYD